MSSGPGFSSSTKRIVGRVAASRDPLGVAIIVLLRLDVGSDIFRRHQPDVGPWLAKTRPRVMGAAARLHPDNASRRLLRQPGQRLASHPALHHNRAGRVKARPRCRRSCRGRCQAQRYPSPSTPPDSAGEPTGDAGRRGGPFHKLEFLDRSQFSRPRTGFDEKLLEDPAGG